MIKRNNHRKAVVDFVVGGCCHGYVTASKADMIVVVDSVDEVSRLPDLPNLIKLPVGDHETVLTLLERLQETCPEARPVLERYQRCPSVYLTAGMAQDPDLGALAVKDLMARGELPKIFDQVLVRLLEATNGQLSLIEARELNSNAGGMGSGGAPEMGALFLDFAEPRTNALFHQHMIRFGGLTYVAVAKRAARNTGTTTRKNLQTLQAGSYARRTRDLEFFELPLRDEQERPVREKRELRERLAATVLQARLARGVADTLDAWEINHKPESLLGEVRRFTVCWSEFLDQNDLMRGAATCFRDELRAFRTELAPPDMQVAQRVEVKLEALNSPWPEVEEVMQAIRRQAPGRDALLDRLWNAELRQFEPTVTLYVTPEVGTSLDQVLGIPEQPRYLSEARRTVARYRGVIAHLERAQQDAEQARQQSQKLFEKRRRNLGREIGRLRSFRHSVEVMILSRRRVLRRFQTALEAYRDAYEHHSQAKARAEALTQALNQSRSALAGYVQQWITGPEQALAAAINKRWLYLDTALFTPLDTLYGSLLDALQHAGDPPSASDWGLRSVLLRAVTSITLKGIAQMLGTDPDIQSIVTALGDANRFPWKSPQWGGETTYVEPRYRFVVLPAMGQSELEQLQRVAQERGLGALMATADSVAAGCSIVTLAVYPVSDDAEILTPAYMGRGMHPEVGEQVM